MQIQSVPAPAQALNPDTRRRGLWGIFLSTFLELAGYFMFGPLLVLTLAGRGLGPDVVGLFTATAWAGVLVATPFASHWVDQLGKRRSLIVSAAVPFAAFVVIALVDSPWLWAGLYFVAGVASSLRWIAAEATVAELAPPDRRGRFVGLFETMVGTTFVVGPALLAWVGTANPVAPWLALALIGAGLLATYLVPDLPHVHAADTHDGHHHLGLRGILTAVKAAPVIMIAGFVGGFFESGITSLLPVYGLALGFTAAAAALLLSASGLGSSLMMWPLGELADRISRRAVFVGCAAVTLAGTLLLPLAASTTWLAWGIAFLWGSAGGALYTLAMIEIGTRNTGTALVSGTSVLVLSYTLGGMLAPALGGLMLKWAPTWGFTGLLGAVAAGGLAALIADRSMRRTQAR
jgi:MFS family permease